jgi:dimethylhistidine N-methyltransferase
MGHRRDSGDRFSIVETVIRDSFADAVRTGLSSQARSLPPHYFYDAEGTRLFDRICDLPEYYLTRAEMGILGRLASELPPAETVIEFGGGTGAKARILFQAFFQNHAALTYVPVDISKTALLKSGQVLLQEYPRLRVRAIQAEFTRAFQLLPRRSSLVLFLGSNIGNFNPEESVDFLSALRGHRVLAGFDMQKERSVLHAAYNDAQGVTAQFNLNLLARINRELGGTFDLARWEHLAFYDEGEARIEMHLVSRRAQEVRVAALQQTFAFKAGEQIHTENSYKFSPQQIEALARKSGFRVERLWTDPRGWFSVALLS